MKNSYLFLSLCFGIFSGSGIAQNTYVAGSQKVKVNPNTLFYVGGNLQINAAVTQAKVVENAGNIKVDGLFINAGDAATGKNFVSTWDSNASYGQVIIKETSTNSGGLTMEKGKISPSSFTWGQFSIPFNFATANDAMSTLFGTNYSNGAGRYYASMMVWDNTSKPEFDHLNNASTLKPYDYVILNLNYYSAGLRGIMENTGTSKLAYSGRPTNGAHTGLQMNAGMYFPGQAWANWANLKNTHNEKYNTYISDELRVANSTNFGKNHFQFGNPYTSNLDLSSLGGTVTNLLGVIQYNTASWTQGSGLTATTTIKASYDGVNNRWVGNPNALIVKPFEPFVVVLTEAATGTSTLSLGDNVKTFSMTPTGNVVPAPFAPKTSTSESNEGDIQGKVGNSNLSVFSFKKGFYQLGLFLYDEAGNETGNQSFVAVTDAAKNGIENSMEAEYSDFASRSGFYLAQENANGTVVNSSARKMYINTVGLTYNNKPIPFFFNRSNGDTQGYYIKAKLYKDNIFNELTPDDRNFDDGNSFFFYDYKADELLMITTDFNFYVSGSNTPSENRYQIYWNGRTNKADLSEVSELYSTIIYKDQANHKVKFNETWDSAEVKVYDLSGRKILEYSNVKTKNDFEIKLPTNGVYVVKIVANNGDIYTQKIIK